MEPIRLVPPVLPDRPYHLTVVVPAFHEERIGETVLRLRTELGGGLPGHALEIVVVDDGSRDDTADLAERAGAEQVLRLPENRGKGAAVRCGVLAARGRVVAFTDADLAYSPDQLAALVARVEGGWDVAVGSREHAGSTTVVEASPLRRIGHRAIALATRAVLSGRHTDSQCGLKAFRADIAQDVFARGRIERFAFDIEVLHIVDRLGYSVTEVPVAVVNSDRSTVRVARDALRLARDLVRIRWWSRTGAYDRVRMSAGPGSEPVVIARHDTFTRDGTVGHTRRVAGGTP